MKPKVSIIIPIFNSYHFLKQCIDSIKQMTKEISYELVLIDDASTEQETKDFLKLYPTETFTNPQNEGFIKSCNVGAKRAVGKYLLFLNSDTLVIRSDWLKNMVECFKQGDEFLGDDAQPHEIIGVVGAKLLLPNNTIQHAGMSYVPTQMNFMHDHYGVDGKDPRVCTSKEVEMVTGACLMTPRKVWDELGGFDMSLVGGTFEDTFFCLEAKKKDYKVWYCAEAELYHFQSQSMGGAVSPEWYLPNWELFKQRYIRTEHLGPYPKICVTMIAFNEEDYIAQSLQAVYEFAHRIVVVEGSTESTREFANEEGHSTDNTNKILAQFDDPQKKLQVYHGKWKDKDEMRNECAKHAKGCDYAFVVDADEVWPRQELLKIENILFARPELRCVSVNMHEFWQDLSHKCRGPWENFLGRKTILKLDKGLEYKDHLNPADKDGNLFEGILAHDIYFYHYNYAKPDEKIRRKIQYYINRGTPGFNLRKDWFETVWMAWKKAPAHVEKEYGTHPFGGGWTEPFMGDHPEAMHNHPQYKQFVEDSGRRVILTTRAKAVKGYTNFDMEKMDIKNFPMGGLKEIVADDCLEHFPFREVPNVLVEWYKRLDFGGRLTIVTPDLRQTCEAYVSGKFNYATTIQFLYALQSYPVNVHYVCFDEPAIRELLENIGFKNIKIEKRPPAFLYITGWKV